MPDFITETIPYPNHKGVSGIYAIICASNDKIYIGSAENLMHRRNDHLSYLRRGIHPNIHLQRAFTLYGEASFDFKVIELCPPANLLEREQYFIDNFHPEFNIAKFAGSPMKGRKQTIDARRNMSNKLKGRPHSEEHRKKISEANKGRIVSNELKRKISEMTRLRTPRGERHPFSKFTEKDIEEIRRLSKEGLSHNAISKIFDVNHSTIDLIISGETWSHVK